MEKLTVICPVYEEEKVIKEFYNFLRKVLDEINNYESSILFVVDPSSDSSFKILTFFYTLFCFYLFKRVQLISYAFLVLVHMVVLVVAANALVVSLRGISTQHDFRHFFHTFGLYFLISLVCT